MTIRTITLDDEHWKRIATELKNHSNLLGFGYQSPELMATLAAFDAAMAQPVSDFNHIELALPVEWLARAWNEQADEFNQWDSLESSEQLAWAQIHAVAVDRKRHSSMAEPKTEGPPLFTLPALLNPGYEPGGGSAEGGQLVDGEWWHPIMGCDSLQVVANNARAALAQPVGQGPTDEELHTLWNRCGTADEYLNHEGDIFEYARAVLARWGRSAPQPIPVSKPPAEDDCDAKGRCWIHQPDPVSPEAPAWMLLRAKYASTNYDATHWLPYWAIPVPTTAAGEVMTDA